MARLNVIGFETGDYSETDFQNGTGSISTTQKRTGAYSLRANPTTSTLLFRLKTHDATGAFATWNTANIYFTFYLWIASAPSAKTTILEVESAGPSQLRVKLDTDNTLTLVYFNGAAVQTQIGSASAALSTGAWHLIEVKGTALATGGSSVAELKLNGSVVATGTGLTVMVTPANSTHAYIGMIDAATADLYFDDIVIDDAAYPGARQVNILKPRAAGASAQWATGTSALFSAVNEVPHDSDTTYIGSVTSGNASSFAMDSSATGGVVGTIGVIKTVGIFRDEGGASSMSVRLRNGATNRDTTAVDPGATYVALARLDATDPNGGGAWTSGGLDTIEAGAVNSAAVAARCTALYVMVECAGTPSSKVHQLVDAGLVDRGLISAGLVG